jgi:XTP/dITP diphosphohydrolase
MSPTPETILLGTTNTGKLREFDAMLAQRLPAGWRIIGPQELGEPLPEVVEDADTFYGNAAKKALELSARFGCAVLAEDSGLVVEALGGEPGVYSARWSGVHGDDAANNRLLVARMSALEPGASRAAHYEATICLATPLDALGVGLLAALGTAWEALPEGVPTVAASAGRVEDRVVIWVRGVVEGEIVLEPRGEGGFGYDPYFLLPEQDQTMAQLTLETKNQISHRAAALASLAALLR